VALRNGISVEQLPVQQLKIAEFGKVPLTLSGSPMTKDTTYEVFILNSITIRVSI